MTDEDTTRVAVAIQGGGVHTLFSAGALKEILSRNEDNYDIVGLSGASGGAICAILTWYALLQDDRERAIELLDSFWEDIMASTGAERLLNWMTVELVELDASGAGVPRVAPENNPYSHQKQQQLRQTLEDHIDFDRLSDLITESSPALFIGAVEIRTDTFTLFEDSEIGTDEILASAALPKNFPPVEIDGDIFWDGLLSENPPIDPLTDTDPDEIWVIQHDPERRTSKPSSLKEITDRRNELSGNLSVDKDIKSIERINEMIDEEIITHDDYKHIEVRRLMMSGDHDYASKFNRSPSFMAELLEDGAETAAEFLDE